MRSARLRRAAVAAVVASLVAAGCGGGGSDNDSNPSGGGTTTLRVAGNSNASALPLWVAMDRKVFDRHGLKVGTPCFALAPVITPIYWAASNAWAETNRDVVKRFQKSLAQAVTFIANDDAAARKALQAHTGFPELVVKGFELPDYNAAVRPEHIERWLTAMREVNDFKGRVDPAKLAFTP